MKRTWNRIVVAVLGFTLLATGSLFASSVPEPAAAGTDHFAVYLAGRASTLLTEIQTEAAGLKLNAETLRAIAGNTQISWQSHAAYLERVKSHINAVGERVREFEQIRHGALPWQQQAVADVTSHAAEVAARTQAAIVYLRENCNRLMVPEYKDHVKAIAVRSADMKQTVDRFVDYDKTQQKFEQLRNQLEIAGD